MDSMNITDEAIAVIGMSCRFPGAPDLDGYWRNLCEGKVSVTFLDRKDLAAAGVDHGLLRDPNYVPATYSLGDIDKFDAAFFGYAGSEAEKIDPQQRTFLECAWESLEDAGYTPLPGGGLEGKSVGVFAGSRISSYLEHACRGLKAGNGAEAFQCLVGNDKDYLCSRVSYKLNLNGPSLCVQTACSSSLSAVHVACENLRSGACDMALAGGVAIDVPQEKGYLFQEGMIFSRDGYCRPFDKNASGTVFSGGAGVVVLKRLADALRDRDHIYAVVLASVVNNDGSRRVGYTAPGEFGQTAVIGEAISLSGLSARDIGLVESHGTGTALGDPIEFAALGKAFGHFTQDRGFCALGAVKANIGHADAASGIASFIKAVMAVHTGHIPPHPLFEEANPALDLDASPFYINTALADWKDAGRPRAAGISSFGIGGSNAHAVIMQAPEEPVNSRHLPDGTPDLFVLSSRTGTMLRALAGRMARALEAPSASLADICFTARASRSRDKVRLAVRATSTGALREALHAFARGGMPEGMLLSGHTEARDVPGDLMDDGLQRVALAYMAGDGKALDALQEKALRLGARRVRLPLTPFQRRRFWPEEDSTGTDGTGREALSHPVWRERFTTAEGKILYGGRLGGKELERMREHRVAGRSIAPGSLLLELLRAAAAREYGADCGLGHVALLRPLPLDGDRDVFFQLILEGDRERGVMELFTSTAPEAPGAWHRTARAGIEGPACSMPAAAPASDEDMPEDIATYYAAMQGLGVSYGPSFRLLREIRSGRGKARTRVSSGNPSDGWGWDPALLDACLQGVLSCIPQQDRDTDRIFVPAGCRHLDLPEQCPADVQVMLELRESPAGDPGDTGTFLLDVSLFDGNGEAVGRMEGLRMSALPPESVEEEAGSPEAARYAVRWIEGEQLPGRARLGGRWLVLADPGPLAEALAARLESDGCHCRVLSHAERDGLPAALDALADGQGRLHVVDAWPLGVPGMADPDGTYDRSVLPLLEIVRQARARDMEARLDLVILTSGTFGPDIAAGAHERPLPGQSLVWGLGPVVCMEHPALRVRLMDLQHPEADDTLFRALACEDGEDRQALRDGRRLLPRLERADDGRDDGAAGPRALVMEGPGLDNLRWQPLERRSPEAGEVEVALAASSLNFRDVMMVMGIYPGEETAVGSDGAGIVTAVGDGVSGIQVGDRVAVSAYGCLRTHITLPAAMTCPLPADISFEQAAALPVAYITACYGLEELAGIRAGQTVLIHAASGGVGLAAMAVCRRAGARIFATAGTPAKRELVRSLGAELVMDSRSTAFAQEVLDATGGRGVDIILNSLAGETQEASFTLVADNGCFVELGKSGLRQAGDYRTERGLMRYRPLDLVELGRDRPDLMAGIFRRAMRGCARGELALLPVTVFAADRHDAAFRHMMQARHTGKIILRWPAAVQTGHSACSGTELVSGGLGGIALRLCADRVRRGCRHLLLLARRQPAAEEAALLEDLRQQGCTVRLALADVSDSSALRHAVDSALKDMPPLKRIWHLAGTLDDDRLLRLDASRFKRVLAPKAEGAWNLHRLSLDHQLEAFVLFSSTASFLGPMGMGNYAAANAFLDELALYRRHLGLPALSINWGAFRDAGMAARQADLRTLSRLGIHTVAPEEGFAVMERLLSRDECRAAVLHMDWPRYAAGYDSDRLPPLLRSLCPATADDSEASVSPEADSAGRDSRDAVMRAVRAKVATILRTDAASLPGDANLIELGVDSLLALDLFQSLEKQFRIRVDRSLLFKEPTIDALASRIASLLDAGKRAQDGDLPVIHPDSAARHEPFPLMDMQQAYWVGRTGALVLGNVSCHVYLELETEDLDLPRWEACWNRLIRHHDMLRCVIMEDGRQRILPEVPPFTVTEQDATGLDAGAAEQMVLECRERMGHEVLSAKEWPLFRVAATRMPGGPIRLHISLDLLVADLHSMNLMMNGLESLYRYPEREPAPLDLSFRDYVLALEAFRKSPRYRKDKEYWLERVAALRPRRTCPWPSRPRRWSARASSAMRRSSTGRPGRTCAKRPPRTS
ncbi:SDR family NAD(P)-dependent oxidoreductase [Desulfovibrio piger]